MIPRAFGRSPRWSLGIEEELFVLDARTLAPAPFPAESFDGERLKPELMTTLVEVTTGVCSSAQQAAEQLGQLRARARSAAEAAGCTTAASGTWPLARPQEQPITPVAGYLAFADYAGPSARRQHCAGLHVHIGVGSAQECLARLEAVLPWLPLLLAVSANSPYVAFAETGLASSRAETLALLPRSGSPPAFADYEAWELFAERLVALGLADSWRRIWWDIRPHPEHGTLELRMPDQPTRVEASVAFAALFQALVAAAEPGEPADRGLYQQNRWAALRFGAQAELVHPDATRLVSVPDLLSELLERIAPTASALGTLDLLGPLQRLAQADEQLALGREQGLDALCRRLVELS